MGKDILFAVWFFLPAGAANVMPIFATKIPGLSKFNTPLDLGRKLNGKSIFGPHKTWRGIISGTIAGLLVFALQKYIYQNYSWGVAISAGVDYTSFSIFTGVLIGLGALAGDAIKSFFKRRFQHSSGDSWFPFDQLDYIAGGLLASAIFVRLELSQYILIIIIWFILHLLSSYIGYLLKLKPKKI